jgi:hypothetical protein
VQRKSENLRFNRRLELIAGLQTGDLTNVGATRPKLRLPVVTQLNVIQPISSK